MTQAKRKQTRPQQQQRLPGHEARMRPRPESKMHEIAPCFVFLAADDSAFFVGQVLHPNRGEIVNA